MNEFEKRSALEAVYNPPKLKNLEDWINYCNRLVVLGFDSQDEEIRKAYAKQTFPLDSPADALAMSSRMSSCALQALAGLRRLLASKGIEADAPELNEPYKKRIGLAVSDFMNVARKLCGDSWITSRERLQIPPEVGDMIVVDGDWHIDLCVVAIVDDIYFVVAGGQGNRGRNLGSAERQFVIRNETPFFGKRRMRARLNVRSFMDWL